MLTYHSLVRIAGFGIDTPVVNNILESLIHQSTIATLGGSGVGVELLEQIYQMGMGKW